MKKTPSQSLNQSKAQNQLDKLEMQSVDEIINQHRDQIGTLQVKDATHWQTLIKLNRDNEYLSKLVKTTSYQIDVVEDQRDMDAEQLLEQEQVLSKLKGKYSKRDNPNEVSKLQNTLKTLRTEETQIFLKLNKTQERSTEIFKQLQVFLPVFYAKLRKMKYTGDKSMNELLLKQIELFQEWLLESSQDIEKVKDRARAGHDSLMVSV